MEDKKKVEPIVKLEKKIDSLEEKFDDFLNNHFAHLAEDVTNLKSNGATLINQNKAMQQNMVTMERNILKALGARAYDWVNKGDSPKVE